MTIRRIEHTQESFAAIPERRQLLCRYCSYDDYFFLSRMYKDTHGEYFVVDDERPKNPMVMDSIYEILI